MEKLREDETVYWLLMQVMFRAKHRVQQIAEGYGLTMMQSNTLIMLGDGEPLPMRVLSDQFMCDASNVTGLVDRLEAQELIKRLDHPTDRRIKLITLTPKGTELREKILAETVEAEARVLNPILSEEQRTTLRDTLETILAAQPKR